MIDTNADEISPASGRNDELSFYACKVPGKGYGAFASKAFVAGDVVFTESLSLCLRIPKIDAATVSNDSVVLGRETTLYTKDHIQQLEQQVASLSSTDMKELHTLSNVFSDDECLGSSVLGVFKTNCFDIGGDGYDNGSALYLRLARINHSCSPNCRQQHHPDTMISITATKDIAAGEELSISYIDIRSRSTRERREILQNKYRFYCSCILCNLNDTNAYLRRFMPSA
jgi:hypothetical protein